MKIITIVGARPQFIKAAVVSRAFSKLDDVNEIIIHTGQHFDNNMSDIFFNEMKIPTPKYNLSINTLTHGAMTGRMLEEIEKILILEMPDVVLVYGDTNSTLAGALSAAKLHIPVAHVEAGLRSFNLKMPEEINRILTDRISNYLFCPTKQAVENLKKEGFEEEKCIITKVGDVMYDATLYYSDMISSERPLDGKKYILATIHREENLKSKNKLTEIFDGLNEINNSIAPVILPLHPGTKKKIENYNIKTQIKLINPVGYFDMLNYIKNCEIVITDSGGLQKESNFFNKFCVTLREETEWIELIENQVNFLVGSSKTNLLEETNKNIGKKYPENLFLYGNGNAGELIANKLKF